MELIDPPRSNRDWTEAYWAVSVPTVLVLAGCGAWLAISRFPIPDSEGIEVGFLLFFLIAGFKLVLLGARLGIPAPDRERSRSTGKSIALFLAGLLLAAFVGFLPWAYERLTADSPWIGELLKLLWWTFILIQILVYPRMRRAKGTPPPLPSGGGPP